MISHEILDFLNKHLNINLFEFVSLCLLAILFILLPLILNLTKTNRLEVTTKAWRLFISLTFAFIIFNSLVFEEEKLSAYQKIIGSGLVIFISINTFSLVDILMRTKFGTKQIVDGNEISSTTYSSRVFTLSFGLLVVIAAVIALLHIFGLRSWLEAGGVVGFIGVFLALTQGSWAPDVIGGLILLGTQTLREGDIVV